MNKFKWNASVKMGFNEVLAMSIKELIEFSGRPTIEKFRAIKIDGLWVISIIYN